MRAMALIGLLLGIGACLTAATDDPEPLPATPRTFRFKLQPFVVPPSRVTGLVLAARINGGPPLRLLLDSGAKYIVLDRKSAAKSRCSGGAEMDLVGAGANAAKSAKAVEADTVEVSGLVMRKIAVVVAEHPLAEGIDGVLPLRLFGNFLIRLDVPAKSLELLPYPTDRAGVPPDAVPALANNDVLFVKCVVERGREGYFLLDTGASYNAVSTKLARELNGFAAFAASVPVRGGTVSMNAQEVDQPLRLQAGPNQVLFDSLVSVDLSTISRYHNFEVAGLIGYPAIRYSVLTVSYRDSLVHIAKK
jgi:hypothetical protein